MIREQEAWNCYNTQATNMHWLLYAVNKWAIMRIRGQPRSNCENRWAMTTVTRNKPQSASLPFPRLLLKTSSQMQEGLTILLWSHNSPVQWQDK